MRDLFIISSEINPKELRKLEETIGSLKEDMRNSIELRYVQKKGQASDHASEASEQSDDNVTVVVCGGDDIIHEVVNVLAYRATPLAIIPMGSYNSLAHTMFPEALMNHPEKAVGLLDKLNYIPIDLVRIDSYDLLGNHLPVWSRYFINVANIGFETQALTYAEDIQDKHGKQFQDKCSYAKGVLRTFQKFRSYNMDYNLELINSDTNEICEDESFVSISICNGKYNNGCLIAPSAKIDDGILDICVTENLGVWKNLRLLLLSGYGKHVDKEGIRMFKATSGIITCKDNSYQLLGNCDGEIFYGHRIRFEVFPEALNFGFFPK